MLKRLSVFFVVSCLSHTVAGSAFAGEPSQSPTASAIASATASGEYEYDEARLTFSVNNEGPDAADLAAKLGKKASGIVDSLQSAGISDGDIRVSGPSISVRYAMVRNSNGTETIDRQRIDGFSGYISVTARFKDFSKLGKAMADGLKLGAAVSGPSFALSPALSEEKLGILAVEATKSALANAKAMIEASGRKPGRVIEIRAEGSIQPMPDITMRAMAVAAPQPELAIPVNPGRANIAKSVTVSLEILEP